MDSDTFQANAITIGRWFDEASGGILTLHVDEAEHRSHHSLRLSSGQWLGVSVSGNYKRPITGIGIGYYITDARTLTQRNRVDMGFVVKALHDSYKVLKDYGRESEALSILVAASRFARRHNLARNWQ